MAQLDMEYLEQFIPKDEEEVAELAKEQGLIPITPEPLDEKIQTE